MAGRRPRDEDDVSLFPFLSILACVIGVLTLLISALALAQMDNESVARSEQFQRVQERLQETRAEISQLQQDLQEKRDRIDDDSSPLQQDLAAARRMLEQLLRQIQELEATLEQPLELAAADDPQMLRRTQALEQMQQQLQQLQERIEQLQAEIAQRQLPPEASQVAILPGGSGVGLDPVFVECDGGSLVLHQGPEAKRIRSADLESDEAFLKLLDGVAASPTRTVVFLIRSDGLGTYHLARSVAETRGCPPWKTSRGR